MRRLTSLLALVSALALVPGDVPATAHKGGRHKHRQYRMHAKFQPKHTVRKPGSARTRQRPAGPLLPLPPLPIPAPSPTAAPEPTSTPTPTSAATPEPSPAPTATASPEPSPSATPTPDPRPFAPTSFLNAPLAADAPLDPMSNAYVDRLQHLLGDYEPYVNTTRYSTPVYTVPYDQPTVRVQVDPPNAALQAAFEAVPIPGGAVPAAGTDGNIVVWQPSTDTMWEFWRAQKLVDGWHAVWGGRMRNVSTNPGHYVNPSNWGATATSIPLLGGLMRISELKAGSIDHALAICLPEVRAKAFSWPAQRSDGKSTDPGSIPEGARFRVDPDLDLDTLTMSPIVRQMAEAVQRYGMVVRDRGGAVAFYGEDPTPTGGNPYAGPNGFFGGRYINQALRAEFPWEHLQVLETQMTYLD